MRSWTLEEKEVARIAAALKTPIAEMKLSVRVINTFEHYGIITADDLVKQPYSALIGMKNLGEKTVKEVKAAVVALGLPAPNWKKPPKAKRPKKRKSK